MPEGARFCPNCGAPLAAGTPEERRLVTVLFCDLVGFTERSDRADPEDVRATLRAFHTPLKEIVELYGGTIDKFIGDAVLGVFGAPVAHEDDPIRAVLAALRIQDAIAGLAASEQLAHPPRGPDRHRQRRGGGGVRRPDPRSARASRATW